MLYLEDDWELLAPVQLSDRLRAVINTMQSENEPRYEDREHISEFMWILHVCKQILGNKTTSLVQILLNEQSQRECAIGNVNVEDFNGSGLGTCSKEKLVQGGWSTSDANVLKHMSVPYHRHEFSLLTPFSMRDHTFSYWPGISFNPGVWDLQKLKGILLKYRSESIPKSNDSLSGTGTKTGTGNPLRYIRNVFNTKNILFEQEFSLLSWFTGMRIGYLSGVVFRHIGDVSSYVLNNNTKRPWDHNSTRTH